MPKFSSLQTKLIRTTEFWMVAAFNLGLIVVAVACGPGVLPATLAAKLSAGSVTFSMAARQLAKGIAGWQEPLLTTEKATPTPVVPVVATAKENELRNQLTAAGITPKA